MFPFKIGGLNITLMTVRKDFFDLQIEGEMFQHKWSELKQSSQFDWKNPQQDAFKVQTFGDELHSIKQTSRENPIDREFSTI